MNKSLSYCMEYDEDHIGASNMIPFEMESVDIGGEGRIYHTSTSGFKYDCYLKDHLGSTRMVVNDENFVTEAFAYQPYGTIIPLEDIAATPQTPTRQQFTGKEFDTEGEDSENGVVGIQAYHFGARVYDPELGIWFSIDPAGQFLNLYGYTTNPIVFIDPTGEDFGLSAAIIGAIIGSCVATATTTVSAVMEYQQTGHWDWGNYLKDVFIQSNIGGSIGFVTGGVGSAISSSISGAVGGLGGSVLGGGAAGAFSGATSYTMNYTMQSAFGYQDWGTGQDFFSGLGRSTLIGMGTGAAISGLSYSAKTLWNNTRGSWQAEFAEGIDGEMPMKPSGSRAGQDFEKDLHSKFSKFAETNPNKGGESAGYYKIKKNWLTGKYYTKGLAIAHFEGTSNTFNYSGYSRPDAFIHSHPNTSYPSFMGVRNDYTSAMKLLIRNITPYLLGADKNLYMISGSANTGYFHINF